MPNDSKDRLRQVGQECFCLHSRMAARAVTRQYNAVLAPVGIGVTEFSLLGSLATGRDSSITDIADRLAYERTTLVRNLKRLVRRELIEPSDEKGRAVRYILTQQGKDLLEKALPLWNEAQAKVTSALSDSDQQTILHSLDALKNAAR